MTRFPLSQLLWATVSRPSFFKRQANPVLEAALQLGVTGLSDKPAPPTSPTKFRPSGDYPYMEAFLKPLLEDTKQRSQLRDIAKELIQGFEAEMRPRGLTTDATAALAFAITTLSTLAGKACEDDVSLDLIKRLQATLDRPEVRRAPDAQKQELYEHSFAAVAYALTLAEAKDAETIKRLKELMDAFLTRLIGTVSERLVVTAKTLRITPSARTAPPTTPPAAPSPSTAQSSKDGLAPGFSFTLPTGWKKQGAWCIRELPDGQDRLSRALIRFPPTVPASGNMGDALRKLWATEIPKEGKDHHSAVVYRRYVGDKVQAQFIGGRVVEEKRPFDTAFTLFLVDCISHWQPIVVALTYDSSITVGGTMTSGFSFPATMLEAEKLLATIQCPAARAQPIATPAVLAGEYGFGNGSKLDWVNVYTGTTSMTYISYGGTLALKPDGTFTYSYSSAAGRDARATFRGARGTGTWAIQEDVLICTYKTYDQGDGYKVKEHRYRIAGITSFSDGVKVAVLISKLELPVNLTTVGDTSYWYSTAKTKQK